MAYFTIDDILGSMSGQQLAQLTNDDGGESYDTNVVAKGITAVQGEMDSYIGAKYSAPLADPVPISITSCAIKLFIYWLYSRAATRIGEIPKAVRDNYLDGVRWLEGVRDGKNKLGEDPPPPNPSTGQAKVVTAPRIFNGKTLRGF